MFIVWGKKIVYRRLGYVADFCPICRDKRVFELKRVGSAGHVYYISAGQGELVGYELICQDCRTSLQTDPGIYASFAKLPAPVEELVRTTFPNIDEVMADRLALEERIRREPSSLSADERRALIRHPFLLLSPKVDRRFASTHVDRWVGLSLVGALLLMMIGPALTHVVAPDEAELSMLLFIVLGVALVVWQVAASKTRFMEREIIPVLAKSLHPLRPTEAELREVMSELKLLRHKMASKLGSSERLAGLVAAPVAMAR
ncbi:hypothetical protein ACNI65_09580 [Roseateles sp. So40a]|uniref:hypothetical protein n=1 Tax=Roseateles sp. So40a TaxID=3400226 RepID=UPI003A880A0E